MGSRIFEDCYLEAHKKYNNEKYSLKAAFSCYYSGNFERGFKKEGTMSYVEKIISVSDVVKIKDMHYLKNNRYNNDYLVFNNLNSEDKSEMKNQKTSNAVVF